MKNMRKALSLIMVFAMLCGLMVTTAFASGATEITTVQDLAAMTDGDYVLKADITINASDWTPVEAFSGTFDGNKDEGYAITWTGTAAGVPNFSIIGTNMGTVKDLKVDGSLTITGSNLDYFSAVVGYNKNTGVIDGVESAVTLDASGHYNVGGVCGQNDGYILNSANTGAVTGYSKVGGIVGANFGTVNSCSNSVQVTGTYNRKGGVGGIAGHNGDKDTSLTGHIWNCYNRGDISASDGSWAGGICGFLNGLSDCVNCYNTGEISGYQYLDNISGNTEGTNYNCYGLVGLEGPEGYDDAILKDEDEMKASGFVSELSAGAAGRWTQTSGSYPVLTNTATVNDPNPAKSLSFSITQMPEKTVYTVGECFDPTGLEITATRPDGTTAQVPVETCTFDPSTSTPLALEDSRVIVSGTFEGSSFSLEIPIVVHIIGIEIVMESKPAKTDYTAGETFDTTGMRIVAHTDQGDVEITDYSLSLDGPLTGTDTVETVYGTYSGVDYRFEIDITVSRVQNVTLGGGGTFSDFERALDAVLPGGEVSVLGTVTIDRAMTRNDAVTVSRGQSFAGPMFVVDADGIVTLTSMTIVGKEGVIFQVNGGTLRLRGNITLTDCATAVEVSGGALVVNKARIAANAYSVRVNSGSFTLEDFGGTSITGAVYLASGKYITAAAAIPCELAVESVDTDIDTVIAAGTDDYAVTSADAEKIELNGGGNGVTVNGNNQIVIEY